MKTKKATKVLRDLKRKEKTVRTREEICNHGLT